MKDITLAGGCFWGVEEYFRLLGGVIETRVGYANGNSENPTYEDVCRGGTGFAEACFIKYDESLISLEQILSEFWKIVDPTLLNRQGNDTGHQYRTGIYYDSANSDDLEVIKKSIGDEQMKYSSPVVTEVEKRKNFYEAENYHQKYLMKNPNGYCHIPRSMFNR
jgi:peptide-methionine (S)-S-oxide reductase